MPFYEYQCKSCGHELEAMQKVSDTPLKKCPHCGKSQLQRLMSAPVFRLKGGGWYETDFKGEQDNKRNLADKPDADAPKVSDSSSSESKADSKDGDSKGNETKSSDKVADAAGTSEAAAAKKQSAPAEKPPRSAKPAAKRAAAKRSVRPKKSSAKARRRR